MISEVSAERGVSSTMSFVAIAPHPFGGGRRQAALHANVVPTLLQPAPQPDPFPQQCFVSYLDRGPPGDRVAVKGEQAGSTEGSQDRPDPGRGGKGFQFRPHLHNRLSGQEPLGGHLSASLPHGLSKLDGPGVFDHRQAGSASRPDLIRDRLNVPQP